MTSVFGRDNKLQGFAKVTRDMTESKKTEQALRAQAHIMNIVNDSVVMRDLEDRITYWNQGAQQIYGWSALQVLGKVTHDLLKTQFPTSSRIAVQKGSAHFRFVSSPLERHGYTVVAAEDGHRGIEIARKFVPTIILLDIQLPAMGGMSAHRPCAALRPCATPLLSPLRPTPWWETGRNALPPAATATSKSRLIRNPFVAEIESSEKSLPVLPRDL